MKMLFNGGLNVSTRDGWWAEAWSPDVGWAFGNGGEDECGDRDAREAEELYVVLEREVIPEFYDRDPNGMPHKWLERLTASMGRLTPRFSSDRMLKEYVEQVYLPAAEAHECRTGNGARVACELQAWHEHLADHWHGLHFGEIHVSRVDDSWSFAAQVYLGELAPTAVCVQLYADSPAADKPLVTEMRRDHPLPGSVNGFVYTAVVAADRPADDFTPRIIPWHSNAMIPAEENRVHWAR
jgi:starch phosphorylase